MNDTVEKTASSLAVVEKKQQRPGGCVGIFFQLFDWNRRFAKKKLFSKKLLPAASKKFGGDEKQPKLRLIADENSGGFPAAKSHNGTKNADNEQKHETRVPGLVARLMGLESMPTLQRDKSKKPHQSGSVHGKVEKSVVNKEELNVEKGGIKHELRPQKLQKTSVCERQPITRFGAEKLPFKNVLSKSRKHNTKLPSPVKSPKNISKKTSSKLIGAATRILEPGLQASRSSCALTYRNTLRHPQETLMEERRIQSLSSQLEESDGFGTAALKGESPCRNCGYSLDNLYGNPAMSSKPLVFASHFLDCAGSSCLERSKPGHSAFCQDLEGKLHDDYQPDAGPIIGNGQSLFKPTSYKSPYTGKIQQHFGSQECDPPKGMPVPESPGPNYKLPRQNHMLQAEERIPPRPNVRNLMNTKVSTTVVNGTKNFIPANQSLCCSTRSRVPARMDNGRFEYEKRVTSNMNDSMPPGRKRRPINSSRQGENSGFMNSAIDKQSFVSSHLMPGKQFGCNGNFINNPRSREGLLHMQNRKIDSGQGESNVVSFAFSSPAKQKKPGTCEVAERRNQGGLRVDGSLQKAALGENNRKAELETSCHMSGDALGALLEQKLKELNSQGEDIGAIGPKKTTAMILQELITALTSEVPFQHDNLPAISHQRNGWCNESHLSNSTSFIHSKANAISMKLSVDHQPLDCEHLSPGSVLETHFSTESYPPSSLDESLGYKMLNESQDCCYYEPQSPNPDQELLNSTNSLNAAESSKELVIYILNSVSEILCCGNLILCLKGDKLDQAKEVLLNAELVFHNATRSGSVVGRGSPIKHLLIDELETLASLLWMNFGSSIGCSLGIEDGKEANQLRTFVQDSILEYLNTKFQGYPYCGSKVSTKLPLRTDNNTLMLEIVEVVGRWEELSRYGLDDLIEREMSLSLGEWTLCETEAFETGMEISRDLLQILVDEIAVDLFGDGR